MAKHPIPVPLLDTLEHLTKDNISNKDVLAVIDFLEQYSANKATFESYRRETERLLQWSSLIAAKSVFELKRQDIQDYIEFCLEPPKSWIAIKHAKRFIISEGIKIPNPDWRPFVAKVSKQKHKDGETPDKANYQLSQKAIREVFTILSSFYNYLVLEEKVPVNPVALIKQKSKYLQKQQKQAPVMRLSEHQWQTCLDIVQELASVEPDKHERTLFILSALYLLYLRISELAASDRWIPQMGHFYQDSNANWWFITVGKGNKMRHVAVSDSMLVALKRYRKSLDLNPLPLPNEQTPLLPKDIGKGPITSTRHIRRLVQLCFDKSIEKLRKEGSISDADALEAATVHWLRHTGISDDINKRNRPVAHVRDDAGHGSSATTDRYNDIELKERHKSAKGK